MSKILDGRVVRDQICAKLSAQIKRLKVKPGLAIIQVGDNPASTTYIKQKVKFGEAVGVRVQLHHYPAKVSAETLMAEIQKLNEEEAVNGIIVQLPLSEHLKPAPIIAAIQPLKDVDGLINKNVTPATARGVINLLDHYRISLSGRHVVVVGRSDLVGKPLARALLSRDATVTTCHSKTKNLAAITKTADIIIVAAGKPKLITAKHVKPGQVIVDVGITSVNNKLDGDVDFKKVAPIVRAISPVPGGVGPLTVAGLFQNLLDLARAD